MQREAVRVTVGSAKVDVPLGTFASGDVAQFDGAQFKGVPLAALAAAMAVAPFEAGSRIRASDLPRVTAAALASNTAYWVYLGRATRALVANYIEFAVTSAGSGAQTAEVAIATAPAAPNAAGQSLTNVAASGSLDALTSTGVKRNSVDLAAPIAAGAHVFVGLRTAMATTQPTIAGLAYDYSEGRILSTAAPGALTGAGPWTGALITHAITWQAPDLRLRCT